LRPFPSLHQKDGHPVHLVQVVAREGFSDPRARDALLDLLAEGAKGAVRVEFVSCYLLDGDLAPGSLGEIIPLLLADRVIEDSFLDQDPPQVADADQCLMVLPKPGVMDPVALSLMRAISALGHAGVRARTGRRYLVSGAVDRDALLAAAKRVLMNEVIEEIHTGDDFPRSFPRTAGYRLTRTEVPLDGLTDDALRRLSKERVLSLNRAEMHAVRDFFAGIGRAPTDIELETIAQTWSEHCKHKTLTGIIRFRGERIDNLLKSTIFRATREIGRADCLSIFVDNAGVIRFDEDRAICMKVETHNHPSAIEPYGGAGTGIGGVIRDIMGTGLGARPILNTDVFCFGPPDLPGNRLPRGTLHPKRIMKGVVRGVRDYGNRMGIPTANGAIYFDERYVGNPLVFCGTVGIMPANMVQKAARPGDLVLVAGGRTGRDGIHGVTFASVELNEESEMLDAGAVQIGNPIEEKKVLDAQLKARDLGLYTAVTDCGGGGLSSAVGEMGEAVGVRVDLDRVPLKYDGLSPLEIWISEAQERMIFAVPPEHRERIIEVFAAEGSEAVVIGEFTGDRRLTLRYEGEVVADLPMEFLHDGLPRLEREAVWAAPELTEPPPNPERDLGGSLLAILGSLNVCSKEWVIRQYDHEVQGLTAVKPLVGPKHDGPGDAVVFTAEPGERRGIVVSCGMNPHYGDLDPYAMAGAAIDEAVRNSIAVGGMLERIALLDNFSWGNTDKPDRLGALVLAAKAIYDVSRVYGTPFISGKDSLNNEYSTDEGTIVIPHTLLVSALSVMDDVTKAVTMDLKGPGHGLYLLGRTYDELGGSHLYLQEGVKGANVPRVRPVEAVSTFRALQAAIAGGLVRSCHDLSEGGLAVAVAEMAYAGETGATVDLAAVPREGELNDPAILFSESQSRFVVEVTAERRLAFEAAVAAIPAARIGETNDTRTLTVTGTSGAVVISKALADIRCAHQATLRW
jgi:phosphoribosylformylglycinamidine synthase